MQPFYQHGFDVLVSGGGHAGVEAALASSKLGCSTLLVTLDPDTIGKMSCNPAIGGIGKGQLVREIDALGGQMALTTDSAGIQFRMLNRRKGPSVWSPRAQCDKREYQLRTKIVCEQCDLLWIIQGRVDRVLVSTDDSMDVELDYGLRIRAKSVVLTTGTFLRAVMHIGHCESIGGRSGEGSCNLLSKCLNGFGFRLARFKTGTPPRVARRSIDFARTTRQDGDDPPPFFSHWHAQFHMEHNIAAASLQQIGKPALLSELHNQIPCFLTHTTPSTADIVRRNIVASPLYSGRILGVGPRYCPSIEDKTVRFEGKTNHHVFLEPESLSASEIYLNGLSTSFPIEIQTQIVRSVVGCEHAEIVRPAYAVEYDCIDPTELRATLESTRIKGLYFAGQVNGTSGYEEAGAQGLIAGINAALSVQRRNPLILPRDSSYIGVLIDDLVSKGVSEPYRTFTSQAEHRLILRHDNADLRLSEDGFNLGLLDSSQIGLVREKAQAIRDEIDRLTRSVYNGKSLAQILSQPRIRYDDLPSQDRKVKEEIARMVETEVKYAGYIARQYREVSRAASLHSERIPHDFDFHRVHGLRTEALEKLRTARPRTIGDATRIQGVTPADISLVIVHLRRRARASIVSENETSGGEQDLAID